MDTVLMTPACRPDCEAELTQSTQRAQGPPVRCHSSRGRGRGRGRGHQRCMHALQPGRGTDVSSHEKARPSYVTVDKRKAEQSGSSSLRNQNSHQAAAQSSMVTIGENREATISSTSRRGYHSHNLGRSKLRPDGCNTRVIAKEDICPRPRVLNSSRLGDGVSGYASMPPTPPRSPAGRDWSSPDWIERESLHSVLETAPEKREESGLETIPVQNFWGEPSTIRYKIECDEELKQAGSSAKAPPLAAKTEHSPSRIISREQSIPKDQSLGTKNLLVRAHIATASDKGTSTVFSEHEDGDGLPTSKVKNEIAPSTVESILEWLAILPHSSTWDQPSPCFPVDYWIVPHQWMEYHPLGDNKLSLQRFWPELRRNLPMVKGHINSCKPWWTKYINQTPAPFIHRSEQPSTILCPDDGTYHLGKAYQSTAEHKIRNNPTGKATERDVTQSMFRHSMKAPKFSVIENNNQNRNPYRKPPVNPAYQGKANIYIRLATEGDVQQLRDIYNHFVQDSWYVPEKTPLTLDQTQARLRDVQAAGWPWLVAVEKAGIDRSNRAGRRCKTDRLEVASDYLLMTTEKIMGFAYASDHFSADSTDHVTAQVHFWVLPECQNSKVGTTLMDRLFFCLLENHEPFTDADYRVSSEPFNVAGGCTRKLHSLLASMQYAPKGGDEARANIVEGFLTRYGFEQYGEQKEVGWRKNLYLNRKLFQRICSENADGAHSDFGAQWDTKSITEGALRFFTAEDDTFAKREERRLEAIDRERGDKRRPLPLVWKPVAPRG